MSALPATPARHLLPLLLLLIGAPVGGITTLSPYQGPFPTEGGWTMVVRLSTLDSATPALEDQVLLHYDEQGHLKGETHLSFDLDDSPSLLFVTSEGSSWWSVRCRESEGRYPMREGSRSSEDCRRWVHRAADGMSELARFEPPRLGGNPSYLPSVGLCSVSKTPVPSPSRLRMDCFEPDRPIVLGSPSARIARFARRSLVDLPSDLKRASSDSWVFGPGPAVAFVGPGGRESMKVLGFSRVGSAPTLAETYELTLPRLGLTTRADEPTEAMPAIGDPWVKAVSDAGRFLIAGWQVDHDGQLPQSAVAVDQRGQVLIAVPLPSRAHGAAWLNEQNFVVAHFSGAFLQNVGGTTTEVDFPPEKWQKRRFRIEQELLELTEADPPSEWLELALASDGSRRHEIMGWIARAWPEIAETIPAPLWPELAAQLCAVHGEAAKAAVLDQFLDSPIDWRRDWTWSILPCFETPPDMLLDALRKWFRFDPRRMDAPVEDAEKHWGLRGLRQ